MTLTLEQFNAYLDEPVTLQSDSDAVNCVRSPMRKDYLCWAIVANGSWRVSEWGIISYGPNHHQHGLDQGDAIQLIGYAAFFDGLEFAGFRAREEFLPYFKSYIAWIETNTKPDPRLN